MPRGDPDPGRDVAVLDVGSNSVRLVIYRLEGRAIWSVYNEKVLAGLGQGVAATGWLSPEGVLQARAALRRFKAVLDASPGIEVLSAATAAVREAKDGRAFIEAVRADTGLSLSVVSGTEEARLGALGVLAGEPRAAGVVGDLGGSSLELTPIGEGAARPGVSLKVGPFALGAPKAIADPEAVVAAIDARLMRCPKTLAAPTLYAVGGAWRNLALIHMITHDYPLRVVHDYALSARQANELCEVVAHQSRASLERIQGVSKKRAEVIPYAAIVLQRVIARLGIKRVVMSAYGVREGLLYETLPAALRRQDPLVAGAEALGQRLGLADGLGPALERWLAPAFAALPPVFETAADDARLLAAASRFGDIAARMHPDHRAQMAAALVLRAPIPGQTHAERAFLATAIHARYHGDGGQPEPEITGRLLNDDQLKRANALGAALRLGAHLSGRTAALLRRADLRLADGRLILTAGAADEDLLLGDTPRKRLKALAEALELEHEAGVRLA